MPKATLIFNLPEEKNEFLIAQRGTDYYCAIIEIQTAIRKHTKYGVNLKEVFKEISAIINDCKTEDIE